MDKLGEDVLLLDITPVSTIADYFVVCTGNSERQVDAIHNHVVAELRKERVRPLHVEGAGPSGWVLVDYGSVVLHIFLPATRHFYDLERLWSGARTIVRVM